MAVVAMEDRSSRNLFSQEIGRGLLEGFAEIVANPNARVVVVHGYDSYFCGGGTAEQLIAISEGRMSYTDFKFFDLLRYCELPTIAAMQGHAIGGGLAFGAHADFMFLAEESMYCANFMGFGFTPGMASTFNLPRVFGDMIGWEMLFMAANIRGASLRDRGVGVPVRKRTEVVPSAVAQARALAKTPRESLVQLKRRRLETTHEAYREAVRRELEMHGVTFTIPEVSKRIRIGFS